MAEVTQPGPVPENACIREAVCIHTQKILDSCLDKDCHYIIFFLQQKRVPKILYSVSNPLPKSVRRLSFTVRSAGLLFFSLA